MAKKKIKMTREQLTAYAAAILGAIGLVSVALFIGSIDPKTGFPAPITVNGQTIEFTWTDDHTGEDLILYTDKQTYTDGISHAEVYVAVENRGKPQDIELQAYFRDNKKRIKNVSVLTKVTRETHTPQYQRTCKADTKASTTAEVCTDTQVGTTTTQFTENVWLPLPMVERTNAELVKEGQWLAKDSYTRKPVENFQAARKTTSFPAATGEVLYYKVIVEFPTNQMDSFFFETTGSEGGYGFLN